MIKRFTLIIKRREGGCFKTPDKNVSVDDYNQNSYDKSSRMEPVPERICLSVSQFCLIIPDPVVAAIHFHSIRRFPKSLDHIGKKISQDREGVA